MSDAEGTSRPPGWDDTEADAFLGQIGDARLKLARQRFAGHDPAVKGPAGARTSQALARLLAADRESALIEVGGVRVNPGEDRAEEALQHAIRALASWGFDAVRRELAVAAEAARTPARQQRVGAIRAVANVARAVVFTAPGGRLRGEDNAARAYLAQADELPAPERQHYAAEVGRLVADWKLAAEAEADWRAWALLRGRIALRAGADESVLAWALRAWDRRDAAAYEAGDPAFRALIAAARGVFRPLADGPSEAPILEELPRAGDVLQAVAAALAHDGSAEPFAATLRFAFLPYHARSEAAADEEAT